MAPLTIHVRAQGVNYSGTAGTGTTAALALAGAAGVDYDLGNGLGATADFQYVSQQQLNSGASSGTNALTGFGAYIKKGFSNGYIGIGFEYSTIGWAGGDAVGVSNASGHWAIPIVASEWF